MLAEVQMRRLLVMTAAVLASKVGGIIINPGASAVTDPEFIERLTGLGE